MATFASNLDGKANFGTGGGGDDTYTAPNEYFVDPTLAADATKRQYQTIAAALAAGTTATDDPIIIRVAENQTHSWDGSNLTAANVDVIIYAMNPPESSETRILFPNPTSLLSDHLLTLRNVFLSGSTNVTVGVGNLLLERCSGAWGVETADTPSPGFRVWTLRYCDLGLVVVGGAVSNETGTCEVYDSRIQTGGAPIWDMDASSEDWTLRFHKTLLEIFEFFSDPSLPVFRGVDFPGGLYVGFQDATLVIYNGSFDGTKITLMSGGFRPPDWETSRIIEGLFEKSGGGFLFGLGEGLQHGLEIESNASSFLPLDAPDGTTARSRPASHGGGQGVWGQLTFNQGAKQWRFAGNRVLLGGSEIVTNSVPTLIITTTEGDPVIDLDPSGSGAGSLFSVKGRIVANNTSSDDGAIWDTDIVVRADTIGFDTVDVLSGSLPVLVWEENVGQYTLQTLPAGEIEVLSLPVTGSITVNGNVLTATAGPRTPGADDFDGNATATEAIVVVDDGSDEFEIAGDFEDALRSAGTFTVTGSTGNDGVYTVSLVIFSGGNTVIGTNEDITDPTVDGNITFDRRPQEVASDIAAAINDAANSFVGVAVAQANGGGDSNVVGIVSLTSSLTLGESSSQLNGDGLGVSFLVTRNSGAGVTYLNAEVVINEGRIL